MLFQPASGFMEFLVNIHVNLPESMPGEQRLMLQAEEKTRGEELARQGHIVRLWRVIGRRENWGLWRARDGGELHVALSSLPMWAYMDVRVLPLADHPSDPAPPGSGS